MSRVQWEYELVERPFCEQIKAMGWPQLQDMVGGSMTGRLTSRVRVPQNMETRP